MNRLSVLIINHFGTNKGDAAILIGTIATLKREIPNIKIVVESSDPKITFLRTKGKAKIVERVIERREDTNILKWALKITIWVFQSMFWGILKRFNIDIKGLFSPKKYRLLSEYQEADIIVSGGGGYIRDNSGLTGYLPIYSILLAHLIRKPVVIYAQSIGPINGWLYKTLTRYTLNKAKLITIRDIVSREVSSNLGISEPQIFITSDAAFCFHLNVNHERGNDILNNEGIKTKGEKLVGVTLMRWHYPGSSEPLIEQENYKQIMAETLDYVIKKYDSIIVLISMNTGKQREDEILLAREIIQKMDCKQSTRVILGEYSPEELKDIISQLNLIIGTRFHSLIFASTVNVPIVSIMYEHKAIGIMKMLNLENYVCNIYDLQKKELISKIDEAMRNAAKIETELKGKINLLQKLAVVNAKLLYQTKFLTRKKFDLSCEDVEALEEVNLERHEELVLNQEL